MRELAGRSSGRGEDLNDAIGNLPGFVASGEDVLRVLDEQSPALRAPGAQHRRSRSPP